MNRNSCFSVLVYKGAGGIFVNWTILNESIIPYFGVLGFHGIQNKKDKREIREAHFLIVLPPYGHCIHVSWGIQLRHNINQTIDF